MNGNELNMQRTANEEDNTSKRDNRTSYSASCKSISQISVLYQDLVEISSMTVNDLTKGER